MKKKIIAISAAALVLICIMISGCNKQLIDTTYSYDYAIINLNNGGVVEGKIESWKDFDDGDQLQIKINGTTYLVHSSNVTMMSGK